MKILITGGAGLVGSHCAEYFAAKKNKVVVVDNLMRSQIFQSKDKSVEYNWHYLKGKTNIKLFKNDVRDAKAMDSIFKKEKPDVIMLDVILPQLDGFSVLDQIKQDKTTKKIPVIMLTNLGTEEDKAKGEKLGALDYLVKASLTPGQVSEKIKQALKV